MKSGRIVLSDMAVAEILEQAEWYESQSGMPLAEGGHVCGIAHCEESQWRDSV